MLRRGWVGVNIAEFSHTGALSVQGPGSAGRRLSWYSRAVRDLTLPWATDGKGGRREWGRGEGGEDVARADDGAGWLPEGCEKFGVFL